MASMLPGICSSIRLVINTFEPRFVGIGCHILRRILRLILDEASSQATARRKKSVEAAQAVLERLKTLVPVLVRGAGGRRNRDSTAPCALA